MSIGYTLSVTIFGGFAPFIAAWRREGNRLTDRAVLLRNGCVVVEPLRHLDAPASGPP
jgi:hypothetical protein